MLFHVTQRGQYFFAMRVRIGACPHLARMVKKVMRPPCGSYQAQGWVVLLSPKLLRKANGDRVEVSGAPAIFLANEANDLPSFVSEFTN